MKNREGDQPLPTPNESPDIQSMVLADIAERRELGISRYGTALQPNNGRDMLRDAYEEAIDLAIYLKGCIVERDSVPKGTPVEWFPVRTREDGVTVWEVHSNRGYALGAVFSTDKKAQEAANALNVKVRA